MWRLVAQQDKALEMPLPPQVRWKDLRLCMGRWRYEPLSCVPEADGSHTVRWAVEDIRQGMIYEVIHDIT